MLTQEQIEKLHLLIEREQYGRLLLEAIKAWKYLDPISNDFGISPFSEKIIECPRGKACLIGASIVGKEHKNKSYTQTIQHHFNISEDEMWSLIEGFDNCSKGEHTSITIDQAYEFGQIVRKIVNPKIEDVC